MGKGDTAKKRTKKKMAITAAIKIGKIKRYTKK